MALTYLEGLTVEFSDSADELSKLADLYKRKLWHQLTDEVEKLVLTSKCKINFITFEEKFIRDWRKHMNTLRYGSLIVQISSKSIADDTINTIQGIMFCEQALKAISDDEEKSKQKEHFDDKKIDNTHTKLLIQTQIALFELDKPVDDEKKMDVDVDVDDDDDNKAPTTPFKIAKNKLDEISSAMDDQIRVCPPLIYSRYHYVCSKLWASQENNQNLPSDISWSAEFYKHAISYLGYTSLSQIANPQKWANDIALAALVAPDFYNFGELSLHPIMKSLEGTNQEWVLEIVRAYIAADVNAYNDVLSKFASNISSNNVLKTAKKGILNEKIRLLSFVNLAFNKASFDRIISFDEVQKITQCDQNNVEYLIMKAMSLNLIKGIVDEIDKTVQVTWVKPAILDKNQIQNLNEKVKVWINKIQETKNEIAPDLNKLLQ